MSEEEYEFLILFSPPFLPLPAIITNEQYEMEAFQISFGDRGLDAWGLKTAKQLGVMLMELYHEGSYEKMYELTTRKLSWTYENGRFPAEEFKAFEKGLFSEVQNNGRPSFKSLLQIMYWAKL